MCSTDFANPTTLTRPSRANKHVTINAMPHRMHECDDQPFLLLIYFVI